MQINDASYENPILKIHNEYSDKIPVFELKTPFSITMELYDFYKDFFLFTWIGPNYLANKTYRISDPLTKKTKPHRHEYFEIFYVMRGTCTHNIEGQSFNFHQGECIVLNHHISHKETPAENCELVTFNFSDKFLRSIIENDYIIQTESIFTRRGTKFYQEIMEEMLNSNGEKKFWHFTPSVDSKIITSQVEKKIADMVTTINQKANGFYFHMEELVVQFFCILQEPSLYQYNCYTLNLSKSEEIFLEIRRQLKMCDGLISRAELAKKLNYDDHHLNRIVQKVLGMSLVDYARTFTAKKAAYLLVSTTKPIEEIIHELGFSNKTYFFNMFKSLYGVTPKQYRETFYQPEDNDDGKNEK